MERYSLSRKTNTHIKDLLMTIILAASLIGISAHASADKKINIIHNKGADNNDN